jgi:hypothetical protein
MPTVPAQEEVGRPASGKYAVAILSQWRQARANDNAENFAPGCTDGVRTSVDGIVWYAWAGPIPTRDGVRCAER